MTDDPKHMALLQRLVKLLNMAEGAKAIGNQAEAEAFAVKAQELMTKHKLEMTDLEIAKQVTDDPINEEVFDPYFIKGIKQRRTKMLWQCIIAGAVADANFCQIATYRDSNRILFMGRTSDRKITIYVYQVLVATAERLVKRAYRQHKREVGGAGWETRGFNSNFLLGFARAIAQRLDEERAKLERQLRSTGVALVRLKDARAEVKAYVDQKHFKSGTVGRAPRRGNEAGYNGGYRAGQSVAMPTRGVESGAGAKQLH